MCDQQLEQERRALDQALDELCQNLDFRLVRLEELIPGLLQDCLAKGISLGAVVLRRALFQGSCKVVR